MGKRDWKFWYENALCGSDKRYKEIRREILSNPADTLQILEAVNRVTRKDPAILYNRGIHERAAELARVARKKFLTLDTEQVYKLIDIYNAGLTTNEYGFLFPQMFWGCNRGDAAGARQVVGRIIELIKVRNPATGERDQKNIVPASLLVGFLQELMLLGDPFCYTWDSLVTAAKNGDGEAEQLVLQSIRIPLVHCGNTKFQTRPFPEDVEGMREALRLALGAQFASDSIWCVGVTDQNEPYIGDLIMRVASQARDREADLVMLVEWFRENFTAMEVEAAAKWDEITNRSTKLLRHGGRDRIRLGLRGFASAGYTDLQLFPENLQFPQTRARYWLRNLTGENSSVSFVMRGSTLSTEKPAWFRENDMRVILDKLLAFIAIDCYHRIVVSPERSSIKTGTSRKKVTRTHSDAAVPVVVRPYIRRLQPGFQPSLGAISRYDEARHAELPSGFTFVKEHNRGYAEEVEFTEPLFTYTEEDLGYANGAEQ